jgi:hypothetical protein
VCKHVGPVWREPCEWCHKGECVTKDYGVCESCGVFGPVGVVCDKCEDGKFLTHEEESN